MPSLTQLREERDALIEQIHAKFAAYGDEWEEKMPADEAKSIAPLNNRLTEVTKTIDERESLDAIRKGVSPDGKKADPPDALKGQRSDEGVKVRDFGAILRDSQGIKAFKEAGSRGTQHLFSLSEAEWKGLTHPETKTLFQLSSLTVTPQRLPDLQEYAVDQTTVADLMLQGNVSTNTFTYMEETTFTNAAAETAEATAKPESALAFTERTENVRKIATWIPATTEALEDIPFLESYLRGRLTFMVRRREEQQLLTGDGTAPNISGIMDRSIQTQAKGTDPVPDAVYKAMTKIRVTGLAEPTAFVVHPNDWQDIRLLRTTDGIYIWGSPADTGVERIWGLQVRVTPMITENTGLVGAFRPFAQVFRRTGIDVSISTEHSTYFVDNKVAILAEERLGLAVYRANAFCSVTSI